MHYPITTDWEDGNIFSVFLSPFLFPSVILHAFFLVFVVRAISLNLTNPDQDAPITVRLADFRESGSVNRSIGAARGPGGPRELPKTGTPIPPAPSTGKLDTGSIESAVPSPSVEPPAAPPKPIPLPGPKVLAANSRSEHVNANETAPDSLVRLPTKAAPTTLPGSAATDTAINQSSQAAIKGGMEGPGIKALNEGSQIPGALKGTGTGLGPYGVPGGSKSSTGLAGGGSGTGSGGGSVAGLKGIPATDFNNYLNQLKKRVESVWKFPDGVSGVQRVAVVFSLDRSGRLVKAEVLDSTDSRLNTGAVEAMKKASPFPPIPDSLKELANEPLRMQFTVTVGLRG